MKINLIAASRQRPVRMGKVYRKWLEEANQPSLLKTIISLDNNDPTIEKYFEILEPIAEYYHSELLIIKNNNLCTVQAINSAKDYIDGDINLIFSDDTDCPKYWDTELINFCSTLPEVFVLKVNDGIGKTLITMPIFSKKYLDSFDYIYNPSYKHMFCDTELTCVASLLGCVIEAEHLLFQHLHHSKMYHDRDSVDDKNQNTFYSGLKIFKERLSTNFGLDISLCKGEIPQEIKEWVKLN